MQQAGSGYIRAAAGAALGAAAAWWEGWDLPLAPSHYWGSLLCSCTPIPSSIIHNLFPIMAPTFPLASVPILYSPPVLSPPLAVPLFVDPCPPLAVRILNLSLLR